jgi:prepilin-type N-terminal cleavage/methylation domain-containing protein
LQLNQPLIATLLIYIIFYCRDHFFGTFVIFLSFFTYFCQNCVIFCGKIGLFKRVETLQLKVPLNAMRECRKLRKRVGCLETEDIMSTQNFKKGFTLIELMVVIVIIGILAAIAIPKLFGMSAKAKASELAPAAGTWIKLQQAYSLESTEYGATFKAIAYTPPDSKVFAFSDATGTVKKAYWDAKALDKMNDCTKGATWIVTMEKNTSNTDKDDITTTYPAGLVEECKALTPSFQNLASTPSTPPSTPPEDN